MKNLFFLLGMAILVSCSSPMNNRYSDATLVADLKAIREAEILDSTEISLLAMYFVRAKLLNEPIDGKSYKDILAQAKALKQKQDEEERLEKELAEKARQEAEAKVARLKTALIVTVFDKGYVEYDYQKYITYKFAFENKTNKDITAFTGQLVFTDLFDQEIKTISLTYDNGIQANTITDYSATTDYNQFRDEDQLLKSKSLKQVKLVWKPAKILFADGTVME
ncbi:MAG: hypothetical protein JXR34_13005 [Bacteroidales bacterium]|nr:hypothetical protein [Bacteroidales bacterium]